jgi:hypothetical protein
LVTTCETGTKILHDKYGEGVVIREQVGILQVFFLAVGVVAVKPFEVKLLEGTF